MFSLQGRCAVVTGAAGFFGHYFVDALLSAGAFVIMLDRNEDRLKCLNENHPARTVFWPVDFYDRSMVGDVLDQISRRYAVDILVNNAFDFSRRTGFNDPAGRLEHATFEQIQSSFEAGAYWAIQCTQALGLRMKERGRGSIINICSMYGVVVPSPALYEGTDKFNPPGYSMAKGALIQFTRYAASFLGPQVRVNALSPGAIPNTETPTYNAVDTQREEEFMHRLIDRTLLKRVGHPRDLIGPLVFLASDASAYMTGHNLVVDGGWTIT